MKEIKLLLCPQPGAKPEYLDTVVLNGASPAMLRVWNEMPDSVLLEGYTRDGWAWKPAASWLSMTISTATKRPHKLSGFVDYLRERKKSCFGRFSPRGVMVMVFTQDASKTQAQCRVAVDMTSVPGCTLKPPSTSKPLVTSGPAATHNPSSSRKKKGFLGSLVQGQHRTNEAVATSAQRKRAPPPSIPGGLALESGVVSVEARTAGEVLNSFRERMQERMLEFDEQQSETVIQVKISAAEEQRGLSEEDKSRITMEILKYMVYEAAEEVNEEWIAHKEPSEFMDEVTISVYKEGAAPPEILEEINKGDLPEEVRGQQRALQGERQRQAAVKESKQATSMERDFHRMEAEEGDDDFAALNAQKRDRRTIEDYEREKAKRARAS